MAEAGAASRSGGAIGKKGLKKARITATRSMDPEEAESALPSPRPTFSRFGSTSDHLAVLMFHIDA